MDRRYLLKGMGFIALYGSLPAVLSEFISSCKTNGKPLRAGFFSNDQFHLVEQITDALLPSTATPGAVEVGVPYFIDLVVKNCLSRDDQQAITKGLQQMNDQHGQKFSTLSPNERSRTVKKIDVEAFKDAADKAWFRIVKRLALIGYFTSKEGMTKALNYIKVPGEYKACIPYKQGDKALAKTFL
ncbi:MAG TPA: gluconate 2-dehydrogenase subunit 3 family protein, partial [Chitinophagaceae bacterium]|nr:gluconate 2-dehydrogenase subunit 3 family protein [Chitinophagaceae bacterium]